MCNFSVHRGCQSSEGSILEPMTLEFSKLTVGQVLVQVNTVSGCLTSVIVLCLLWELKVMIESVDVCQPVIKKPQPSSRRLFSSIWEETILSQICFWKEVLLTYLPVIPMWITRWTFRSTSVSSCINGVFSSLSWNSN